MYSTLASFACNMYHGVLNREGFKGDMYPKVPEYSPLLPKAPQACQRVSRYLAPHEASSLKNLETCSTHKASHDIHYITELCL